MDQRNDLPRQTPSDLRSDMEVLRRENEYLRRQLGGVGASISPNFHPQAFMRARMQYIRWLGLMGAPILLVGCIPLFLRGGWRIPKVNVGPLMLFDFGGMYSGMPGIGMGVFAIGGLSIGVVAIGGFACGLIAIGGGAIGVFAIGGGSLGLVAIGGSAVGVIVFCGVGYGWYVLADRGAGRHVFSLKRQDPRAVAFWTKLLPRLRAAITNPLPVIPVETKP